LNSARWLAGGWYLDEYVKKNVYSSLRNAIISKLLYINKSIEKFGSGFERIDSLCKDAGLKYSYDFLKMGNIMNDELMYNRFLDGDDDALEELIEKYGNALTLYIAGYTGNIHDAEDLMMDAFAYLVAKRPRIREGGFRPYLYKMARHYALRYLQKKRRHREFSLEELEITPEAEKLTEEIAFTKERKEILHLCMEKLPADYREALYLVYFEEMSYKEAAAVMKKREKQLDNLVQRGKKQMHALLEKEGIDHA